MTAKRLSGRLPQGFNVAEAINFATPDWIPYGISSLARWGSARQPPRMPGSAMCCSACLRVPAHRLVEMVLAVAPHVTVSCWYYRTGRYAAHRDD